MNEYAYVEEIDEDHVRVWPLTDSELTWNEKPVLTKQNAFTLETGACFEYEPGNPGYYRLADIDKSDPPEMCELGERISVDIAKPNNKRRIRGRELGIPKGAEWTQSLRDRAYGREFDILGTDPERLCWTGEGVHAWIEVATEESKRRNAEKKRRDADKEKRETQEKLKEFHDGGKAFINPYTFVPLPDKVKRDKPHGHARAVEGGLTGYLDVEFAFRSPLMMPVDWNIPGETTVTDTRIEERVTVPGSSVRGAVRSLFEVISSSCLSILDPDYLPVHREHLGMHPEKQLAVVDEVDSDGKVISVLPTSKVVWIRAKALWRLFGRAAGLRSGVRISFDNSDKECTCLRSFGHKDNQVTREQLTSKGESTLTKGGDWVVHVADAGAKSSHPADHIYVAAGKLETTPIRLGERTWEDYRELCRYSADVTGGELASRAPAWDAQDWPEEPVNGRSGTTIGKRRKSDGALAPGDSVWITTRSEGGERVVAGLTMSSTWRKLGEGPIRNRLPDESLLPCCDPDELCPACATFGFIEARAEGQRRDQAEHNAYASHLRFGAFETDAPAPLRLVLPPPARSPRPSAGAFYLESPDAPERSESEREDGKREIGTAVRGEPASHWGGRLDSPRMRRIAGRKFYWHGQEPEDTTPTPRQVRRNHYPVEGAPNCQETRRWITEKPPVLRGRIHFENIDARQLGLLMLALEPRELAKRAGITVNGELATHLGGGKGLGFGTAVGRITETGIQDAAGRYRAGAEKVEVDPCAAAMQVIDPDAPWITGLVKALGTESVPADRIWYPTMGNFTQRGSDAEQKEFDKSFEYYATFSGGKNNQIRMRTLPRIDDPIQYMSNEK